MKKRNRGRRHRAFSLRHHGLNGIYSRAGRKRKAWTFERLEERHLFSVNPFIYQPGMDGLLSQEEVSLSELYWSVKQAGVLSQYDPAELAINTQWAVLTNVSTATGAAGEATDTGFSIALSQIDTTGLSLEQVLNTLNSSEDILGFYPLMPTASQKQTASFLDEPLFPLQWHLQNTGGVNIGNPDYQEIFGVPGEDINVVNAWNRGYSGAGVIVAVVDTGVQINHPDLIDNINTVLGNITQPFDPHGTAVAGLIAADGDNGYGTTGVAPNATLVPVDFSLADSAIFSYRNDVIDIYNHSWGPAGLTRAVAGPTPDGLFAMRQSVLFGRPVDGVAKGVIHVFASGNNAGHDGSFGFPNIGEWESAQYDGFLNRYVVGVGGIDHDGEYFNVDGTLTNYPETGANVLVVAPTGSVSLNIGIDLGTGSGIFTTDLTGDNGYNVAPQAGGFEPDNDYLDDPNFTSRFNGTSAATPIVSGVIALMLEANPNLTYRDVQEILLRSASYANPTNEGWEVNYREVWEDPAVLALPLEDPYMREDSPTNAVTIPGPFGFPNNAALSLMLHPIDDYTIHGLPQFTNGAGYSVNYGRGVLEEETGWAHGVVDAELAVKLAEQWHTRDQDNRPEVTYTTFFRPIGGAAGTIIAAAFVRPQGAENFFVVPGSWGDGDREFEEYYDEFFADMPFTQMDPPVNDRGFIGGSSQSALPVRFFEGFTPPLMEVEWVELKLEINGPPEAFNELRLAIKSPDGTISDLNHFLENDTSFNMNFLDRSLNTVASSPADGGGTFVWTFSSNRHWGERTDDYIEVDPTTGQYRVDPDGELYLDTVNLVAGLPTFTPNISHTWEIIAENYGNANVVIGALEFIFHGQTLAEGAERVQGKVGIDSNLDGSFNWFREVLLDNDGDGFITFADNDFNGDGIVDVRELDVLTTNPEKYGENIVVQAFDKASGLLVDEFVTGADGNYYFDLAPRDLDGDGIVDPTDYDIKLLASSLQAENLVAKDDTGTLDPRYLSTWTVTIDPTDLFTRNGGREVPIDNNRDLIQDFNDANMNGIQDPGELAISRHREYRDVHFLLDPGAPPDPNIQVSGFVFADVNGNGVFDGADTTDVSNFRVYMDLNNSGQFELGEPIDPVDAGENGFFTLSTMVTAPTSVRIRAESVLQGWTATVPVGGQFTIFASPGDAPRTGLAFGFRPPVGSDNPNPPPTPGDDPGSVLGSVYNDINSNGLRDANEFGVGNIVVFIDLNTDGDLDIGEPTRTTTANGAFSFTDVEPGPLQVRIIAPSSWQVTSPASGVRSLNLNSGGTITNVLFGLRNLATHDFGDLPDSYSTLFGSNGPRHRVEQGFQLGTRLDGEVNGQPSADALGDDNFGFDDDDGVLVTSNGGFLQPGSNTFQVTVFGIGGRLNAWIDWNDNGQFDSGEHVGEFDLDPGTHSLNINAPGNMAGGPLAARFRWGPVGLSPTGLAHVGEVEDYYLLNSIAPSIALAGDFDRNGTVNWADHSLWMSAFGKTVSVGWGADGNMNGQIDAGDYVIWRRNMGQSLGASAAAASNLTAAPAPAAVESNEPSQAELVTADSVESALKELEPLDVKSQAIDSVMPVFARLDSLNVATSLDVFAANNVRVAAATSQSARNDDELLLLDQAWALLDDDGQDADNPPLVGSGENDDESLSELALAAVFNDDTDWRKAL